MKQFRKIINYVSWIVVAIIGILLIVNWNSITSSVVTHIGLGRITYGDKSTLIMLLAIEIIVNVAFTLGYDIPFINKMKKLKQPSFLIDIIAVILQIMALLVFSTFIITAIY